MSLYGLLKFTIDVMHITVLGAVFVAGLTVQTAAARSVTGWRRLRSTADWRPGGHPDRR